LKSGNTAALRITPDFADWRSTESGFLSRKCARLTKRTQTLRARPCNQAHLTIRRVPPRPFGCSSPDPFPHPHSFLFLIFGVTPENFGSRKVISPFPFLFLRRRRLRTRPFTPHNCPYPARATQVSGPSSPVVSSRPAPGTPWEFRGAALSDLHAINRQSLYLPHCVWSYPDVLCIPLWSPVVAHAPPPSFISFAPHLFNSFIPSCIFFLFLFFGLFLFFSVGGNPSSPYCPSLPVPPFCSFHRVHSPLLRLPCTFHHSPPRPNQPCTLHLQSLIVC